MEKISYKPFNPNDERFTRNEGPFQDSSYTEIKTEDESRKQFSYPFLEIEDYINDVVVPFVETSSEKSDNAVSVANSASIVANTASANVSTLTNRVVNVESGITNLNNTKQGKLIAGQNIAITEGNVISATGEISTAWNSVYDKPLINGQNLYSGNNTLDKFGIQEKLASGENIKTINNETLIGEGNISVQQPLVSGTNIKTIDGQSLIGSGNINSKFYGIDVNNILKVGASRNETYTMPTDGFLNVSVISGVENYNISVNDINVTMIDAGNIGGTSAFLSTAFLPLKQGDIIKAKNDYGSNNLIIYGLK